MYEIDRFLKKRRVDADAPTEYINELPPELQTL